jgi:hypothetical protein
LVYTAAIWRLGKPAPKYSNEPGHPGLSDLKTRIRLCKREFNLPFTATVESASNTCRQPFLTSYQKYPRPGADMSLHTMSIEQSLAASSRHNFGIKMPSYLVHPVDDSEPEHDSLTPEFNPPEIKLYPGAKNSADTKYKPTTYKALPAPRDLTVGSIRHPHYTSRPIDLRVASTSQSEGMAAPGNDPNRPPPSRPTFDDHHSDWICCLGHMVSYSDALANGSMCGVCQHVRCHACR